MFDSILNISKNPIISGAYLVLIVMLFIVALYLLRRPFHGAVGLFFRMVRNGLRFSAASILMAEKKMVIRNREVLMAEGLKNAERTIEREFERINNSVASDMQGYPALHRRMSDFLTRLEEDYQDSADIPPELPDWINMIEAIANIKHSGDTMVSNMLGEINRTLQEQHKTAIESFRNSSSKRHSLINRMLPLCRGLQKSLTQVGKSVSDLNERAVNIDQLMDEYQDIRRHTDMAERKLVSSSITRFIISGVALLVVLGISLINYNLVSLPMADILGDGSYLGPFKTYNVAGICMIMLELGLGAMLMESFRITRLFPIIGGMDSKKRYWCIGIALAFLTLTAVIGSALAFLQDRQLLSEMTLNQILSGTEAVTHTSHNLTVAVQMILGFIFPFILIGAAIPLELFIGSSRTVVGKLIALGLRVLAFILRFFGFMGIYLGKLINIFYDFIIYPTLWLEGLILGRPYRISKIQTGEKIRHHSEDPISGEKGKDRVNPEYTENPE